MNLAEARLKGPVRSVEVRGALGRGATEYDIHGQFLREVFEQLNGKGSLIQRTETLFLYDSSGRRIQRRYLIDGKDSGKEAYAYNAEGRMSAVVVTNEEGDFIQAWFYGYDERGNRVWRVSYFRGDGQYWIRTDHEFDRNNRNVATHVRYPSDPEENIDHNMNMTYDEKGQLIEVTTHVPQGEEFVRDLYHYDDRGELKKFVEYDHSGEAMVEISHSAQYDEHGNWIRWEELLCRKFIKGEELVCRDPEIRQRMIRYHSQDIKF